MNVMKLKCAGVVAWFAITKYFYGVYGCFFFAVFLFDFFLLCSNMSKATKKNQRWADVQLLWSQNTTGTHNDSPAAGVLGFGYRASGDRNDPLNGKRNFSPSLNSSICVWECVCVCAQVYHITVEPNNSTSTTPTWDQPAKHLVYCVIASYCPGIRKRLKRTNICMARGYTNIFIADNIFVNFSKKQKSGWRRSITNGGNFKYFNVEFSKYIRFESILSGVVFIWI